MKQKVYVVLEYNSIENYSEIKKIFKTQEQAERFVKEQVPTSHWQSFDFEEWEVEEE